LFHFIILLILSFLITLGAQPLRLVDVASDLHLLWVFQGQGLLNVLRVTRSYAELSPLSLVNIDYAQDAPPLGNGDRRPAVSMLRVSLRALVSPNPPLYLCRVRVKAAGMYLSGAHLERWMKFHARPRP
jgi:hypothetical protein